MIFIVDCKTDKQYCQTPGRVLFVKRLWDSYQSGRDGSVDHQVWNIPLTAVWKSQPTAQVSCKAVAATNALNSCNVIEAVLYLCPLFCFNRNYVVLLPNSSRIVLLMYCCSGHAVGLYLCTFAVNPPGISHSILFSPAPLAIPLPLASPLLALFIQSKFVAYLLFSSRCFLVTKLPNWLVPWGPG